MRSAPSLLALASGLLLAGRASAIAAYTNTVYLKGSSDWLNAFYFDNIPDPSGGVVEYVDQATAQSLNLYGTGRNGGFRFGADATQTGTRKSLRFKSKQSFKDGIYVFDVQHAPAGCGTWPALWTFAEPWPYVGEIDIFEQVNGVGRPNTATLHTSSGCTMPSSRNELGTPTINDCNVEGGANGNAGCGVNFNTAASFGQTFNNNGGGVFAMQRDSSSGVFVWFWPRGQAPANLVNGSRDKLDPALWGQPQAAFPSSSTCDFGARFSAPHQVIMNIDTCGPFVDAFWAQDGCSQYGSCVDFSANNPQSFKEAFFDINSFGFWALDGTARK